MKALRKYSITAQLLSLIVATTSVAAAEPQYHLGIKSHASDATFAESTPSFTPFFRLTSHAEVVGSNLTADPLFSKSSSEWNFTQGGISLKRGSAIIKHGKFAVNWGFSPKSSLFMSENAVPFIATHAELSFDSLNTRSFLDSGKFQFFSGTLTGNSLPANTQITGMRYSVKPLPYLSLEGLRVTQWGGEGFLNGWSGFKRAMFGNSNEGDRRNVNHVAGYGVSITVPSRLGKTQLYSQHMGEDEASGLPSCYSFLAGASHQQGQDLIGIEIVDTRVDYSTSGFCGPGTAYNNNTYKYISGNRTMGAPIDSEGRSIEIYGYHQLTNAYEVNYSLGTYIINDHGANNHRLSSSRVAGERLRLSVLKKWTYADTTWDIRWQNFDLNSAKVSKGITLRATLKFKF